MKNNWIDFDERPWGKYYVLYEDNLCKVKKNYCQSCRKTFLSIPQPKKRNLANN